MSIQYILYIVYGSFYIKMVELSSCDGDHVISKPNIYTIWPFSEKKILTPGLEEYSMALW